MPNEILYHGVSAIPVNAQGKILLQQRDDRPDLLFPGFWTTFGGAIEEGETPEEAMRRELLEEIELDLPMKLWTVYDEKVNLGGNLVPVRRYIFIGPIDQPAESIKLNEGQALGYFGLEDLKNLKIGFGFEPLFREFFAVYKNLL
jgi:8-oxo-dGTP pyrophosphatase MutT (NUDIX family)